MAELALQIEKGESKKLDVEYELVKIAGQIAWVADQLEMPSDSGAALVLKGIEAQIESLLVPVADLQREVRHG